MKKNIILRLLVASFIILLSFSMLISESLWARRSGGRSGSRSFSSRRTSSSRSTTRRPRTTRPRTRTTRYRSSRSPRGVVVVGGSRNYNRHRRSSGFGIFGILIILLIIAAIIYFVVRKKRQDDHYDDYDGDRD